VTFDAKFRRLLAKQAPAGYCICEMQHRAGSNHNCANTTWWNSPGTDLKFNPEKPLCYKCFKSWEKYSNPDYTEKFCHACGTEYSSTVAKPLCYACYKKLGK